MSLRINWNFSQVYQLILASFLVTMILFPKAIILPIIALVILTIVGVIQKKLILKPNLVGISLIALYTMYALYSIGSNHPDLAASYLEYKLSLIIFPILFSFQPKIVKLEYPLVGLILGSGLLLLFNLINATICYSSSEIGFECFLSSSLSRIHHPTYASVFYTSALFAIIYLYKKSSFKINKFFALSLLIFFSIGIFLCLSLAGLLFYLGIVFTYGLVLVYRKYGKWLAIGFIVSIPVILSVLITVFPNLEGEWGNAKWYAEEYFNNHEDYVRNRKYPVSGSETRLVMWTVSAYEIQKHPLGVGTGNIDDYLSYQLKRLGQPEIAEHNYNPHNQYLQTALEIGIPGLLLLLFILIFAIIRGFRESNWLLILITLNLAFNCLFESMLQRQSGIVFYVFWIALLANSIKKREEAPSSINEISDEN